MDDALKRWTTVGSAGTIDESATGLVSLSGAVVALKGVGPPGPGVAGPAPAAPPGGPQGADRIAVIRYNVTPVDGVFFSRPATWGLRVRFRDGGASSQVLARLIGLNMSTGQETELVRFDSNAFGGAAGFQMQTAFATHAFAMDFSQNGDNHAYFIEATLRGPGVVLQPADRAPAIAAIKIVIYEPPIE